MTYKTFFKSASPATVEGVSFVWIDETEIRLVDENSEILCVVNKAEYECILKVA